MTAGLSTDYSWTMATESVYGTPVVTSRAVEFLDSSKLAYTPTRKQGRGFRVGSKVARSGRRVTTLIGGTGELDVEMISKGLGLLLSYASGDATSTLVSGSTYQQLYTLEASVSLPSSTQQYTAPRADGTFVQHTANGVSVTGFELASAIGEIVQAKFMLDVRDIDTSTAYAAPSYATGGSLFHFAQGSLAIGGTVVAPTATALASGGTSVANIRDFNMKVDNNLDLSRNTYGGGGKKRQPVAGLRGVTGVMTAEFVDSTLRDAFMADTPLALLLEFDSTEALSTGFATLQVVLPEIKLNGELPQPTSNGLSTQSVPFDTLDNLTATQPWWMVLRTSDTAL